SGGVDQRGGVIVTTAPARWSRGPRTTRGGAQLPVNTASPTRVNGCAPVVPTENPNGAPQAIGDCRTAVNSMLEPGAKPNVESGPHVIVPGGPTTQRALPSTAVVPPTNEAPGGATTAKYCHAVVPVFRSAKSYVAPRAVYVALPPSSAAAGAGATSAGTTSSSTSRSAQRR